MKHIEELKIGATAILFCMVMLLVYAVFPQDGFVPSTKAPMPEVPSADNWEDEENYGFQIYTQESNYDTSDTGASSGYEGDSSSDTDSDGTDTSADSQTFPDTSVTDDSSQNTGITEEPDASDDSYVEEPIDDSYEDDSYEDDSYEDGSYDDTATEDPSYTEDFNWNETEETFPSQE